VASLAVRPHRKTEFPPCSDWKRKTLAAPTTHRDSLGGLVYIPNSPPKFYYVKRRFPITSKCRQMHGVLNVDEIKN
jgi:hypothetical protein